MQVQAALKKASTVDIAMLAPLHGPIWRTDLGFIIDLYTKWATYTAEDKAVAVFYSSVYGNTKSAVAALAMALGDRGVKNVKIYDVSKTDISYMIAEAFRVSTIVLAATTYNNGIFPKMHYLLDDMKALCVQNKKVAIIENGTWAPQSGKLMQGIVSEMKNMELIGDKVTIKSSLSDATSLYALADAIAETVKG
jgi:flavorubredoxin